MHVLENWALEVKITPALALWTDMGYKREMGLVKSY